MLQNYKSRPRKGSFIFYPKLYYPITYYTKNFDDDNFGKMYIIYMIEEINILKKKG